MENYSFNIRLRRVVRYICDYYIELNVLNFKQLVFETWDWFSSHQYIVSTVKTIFLTEQNFTEEWIITEYLCLFLRLSMVSVKEHFTDWSWWISSPWMRGKNWRYIRHECFVYAQLTSCVQGVVLFLVIIVQ